MSSPKREETTSIFVLASNYAKILLDAKKNIDTVGDQFCEQFWPAIRAEIAKKEDTISKLYEDLGKKETTITEMRAELARCHMKMKELEGVESSKVKLTEVDNIRLAEIRL